MYTHIILSGFNMIEKLHDRTLWIQNSKSYSEQRLNVT